MSSAVRHNYYPDLDGLHVLAVVQVVLFHSGAGWLPGGFVGVDVFFVLSGFFITRQLLADLDDGRYSILKFYERRASRILPARIDDLRRALFDADGENYRFALRALHQCQHFRNVSSVGLRFYVMSDLSRDAAQQALVSRRVSSATTETLAVAQ